MFTPDLDLIVVTRCSKFRIQDKTGVDTGDGDKWSGVSGLDPGTLTSAIVRIVAPSGVYSDVDVLSGIPDPVVGSFYFSDATGSGEDGLHNLIYKLQTTSVNVGSYEDYALTVFGTTKINATAHGFVTGMYTELADTENYDGEYMVTNINTGSFYITAPFVANETGTVAIKMFQSIFYPYVFCRSEAGVEKMYANLSRLPHGAKRNKYLQDALTVDGLLKALKSAITSANVEAMNYIQAELDQILSFNSVDANI